MLNYQFTDNIILRCPFFSFAGYSPEQLGKVLLNPHFRFAIYIASPQFYRVLAIKEFDISRLTSSEKISVLRYYNRIAFRPTPFGSFASFTVLPWGGNEIVKLDSGQLHLGLDQNAMLELSKIITDNCLADQYFSCNPSLYVNGKEFRFVKTEFKTGQHQLSFTIESYPKNSLTEVLFDFMSTGLKSGCELIDFFSSLSDWDTGESTDYLGFLVNAQLIMSKDHCNLTGEDYLQRILSKYQQPHCRKVITLRDLYNSLGKSKSPNVNTIEKIKDGFKALTDIQRTSGSEQYFYAGLERKPMSGCLSIKY